MGTSKFMSLLNDGSDLEGVTRAQDMQYMRLLRTSMRHIGAWPAGRMREPVSRLYQGQRYFLYALEFVALILEFGYLKNNIGKISFMKIGHSYITFMLTIVAISRTSLVFTNIFNDLFCDFVNEINLFNYKHKSEYAMQTHKLVHKISHFFTLYLYSAMIIGIGLFNMTPLYTNYVSGAFNNDGSRNISFEHSTYYALPFDYTTEYKGYIVVFLVNWYMCYFVSSNVCTIDLLMSLTVFHVWGHLRILIHNIHNFDASRDDATGNNEACDEMNKKALLQLKSIIMHHHLIIEYISRMSTTFGPVLFIYYGFYQAGGCLLLLECSVMTTDALLRYFPMTLIMFQQVIQLSIIFELLGSMTDKLVDAAYCLPWEQMSTSNQRVVYILLRQTQLPLNLRALDMVDVGVQTMTSILKTSFSYFVMLRTVTKEE
uniref:Odorant receptor n=1 Tax=Conogethes punctiferalis TaxID=1133088 RepID=A0A1Y9TJH5_CONPF|nr:odorant receptor 8 [Conogethes punctiferalis]